VDGLDFRPLHGEEVEQSRTGHNWGTARGWGSGGVINGQFVGPENADERSGAILQAFTIDSEGQRVAISSGDVADDHREGGFFDGRRGSGIFFCLWGRW
jgi:hypothetical protein